MIDSLLLPALSCLLLPVIRFPSSLSEAANLEQLASIRLEIPCSFAGNGGNAYSHDAGFPFLSDRVNYELQLYSMHRGGDNLHNGFAWL